MFDIWLSRISLKFIAICFIVLIVEIFLRNFLFRLSIPFIVFIQTHFSLCAFIAQLLSFFGTANGIIMIVMLTYNYGNVYKTFILMTVGLFGSYFGGLLKIIYSSPRPYWTSNDITAFGCEGGWGNPSNHALVSVSFYLTLNYIFIENSSEDIPQKTRRNYLIFTIVFIFLICLSRIFLGVHSINQVLFGGCIGYAIYYFLFHLLYLNTNEPNELISIILSSKYISFFLLLLSLVPFIPYWIIPVNSQLKNQWNNIIEQQCPGFPLGKRFEHESFLCTWPLIAIIPCLLGMWIEYSYIFNANVAKWSRYNFNPSRESESNLIFNSEVQKTCWNHTDSITSVKRLGLISIATGFILIPHFLVSYNDSFALIIGIKMLLPMALIGFFMFSYLKMLCGVLQLGNVALFNRVNTKYYEEQDDMHGDNEGKDGKTMMKKDLTDDFV